MGPVRYPASLCAWRGHDTPYWCGFRDLSSSGSGAHSAEPDGGLQPLRVEPGVESVGGLFPLLRHRHLPAVRKEGTCKARKLREIWIEEKYVTCTPVWASPVVVGAVGHRRAHIQRGRRALTFRVIGRPGRRSGPGQLPAGLLGWVDLDAAEQPRPVERAGGCRSA